jgi:hypothetical protein
MDFFALTLPARRSFSESGAVQNALLNFKFPLLSLQHNQMKDKYLPYENSRTLPKSRRGF